MLVILYVPQAASSAKSLGARYFVLRASPHLDGQWKTRAFKPQKHVLNVCWNKGIEVWWWLVSCDPRPIPDIRVGQSVRDTPWVC